MPKVSKDSANYHTRSIDAEHCALCTMFRAPDSCTTVRGIISPLGWCKFFEKKAGATMAKSSGADDSANNSFQFFIPISKVDSAKRLVSGYASTPALDSDGERVSLDAVKKALPGYMQWRNIREMHTNRAVGVAKEANVDDIGLFLTSKIVDDAAWNKVEEGVYKGYSIGGKKLAKSGDTITELELLEISIVDRPANPECRIEIAKSAKEDAEAFLVKMTPTRGRKTQALAKMAEAVSILTKADEPATVDSDSWMRDGFQRPAKVEKSGEPCEAHGKVDCPDCTAEKRDVGTAERKDLASQGKALPGGGFPIKNKSDLDNARQAVGRAKDPGAARALIRRRAKELGVDLPPKWKKKEARKMLKAAKKAQKSITVPVPKARVPVGSALPAFLTLEADAGGPLAKGKLGSGHELEFGGEDLGFLTLQEGSDAKFDKTLSLGGVAESLPLDLQLRLSKLVGEGDNIMTDELGKAILDMVKAAKEPSRMQRMQIARGNLKKAKKAVGDIEECMKSAHGILKAAYLAKRAHGELIKAGKKPPMDDNDEDDMAKALATIQKGHSGVMALKTFIKAANLNVKKAAGRSGQRGQETSDGNEFYQVPMGVKDLDPGHMATLSPGGEGSNPAPRIQSIDAEWNGKGAKIGRSVARGYISAEQAELMMKNAALKAENDILSRQPAPGVRPYGGAVRVLLGDNNGVEEPGTVHLNKNLMNGVHPKALESDDPSTREDAVAKVIGNAILSGSGRDVFDPKFRGAGGV